MMETVNEALVLLKRQAELEAAMKQPGGIRITEEQELHLVRRRLENFPEAMRAVIEAAHALRRSVSEVSAQEVETWAATSRSN
jgi:hypothetical protein